LKIKQNLCNYDFSQKNLGIASNVVAVIKAFVLDNHAFFFV